MGDLSLMLSDLTFAFRGLISEVGDWVLDTSLATPMGFAVVALAGLVMGFAPNVLAVAPVVFGVAAGEGEVTDVSRDRLRGFRPASAFVLGMATVDAALGFLFGVLGYYYGRTLSAYLGISNILVGVLLLVIGLALLRIVTIRIPLPLPNLRKIKTAPGAYFLGIPFGLAICPACTPLVLPVIAGVSATGYIQSRAGMQRSLRTLERVGGAALILTGLYFLYQGALYKGFIL
jgi:cytochrome c-type biogenesis protein